MKKFTIFGNPVSHSISPNMHNGALDELNIKGEYSKCQLENADDLKKTFFDLKLDGANVTVPFKEDAFNQCDEVCGIAKKIKAVNTLVNKNGKIIGFNTDAPGFMMSIEEFLPLKSALILGAGGTAKALSYALKEQNVDVEVLNRSEKRLKDFTDFKTFSWDTFKPKKYDIIINTTSAGLHDNNLPAPREMLTKTLKLSSFAFDVIYHKKTPFASLVHELNIPFKDGKDMLLYQGVLAFNLFFHGKLDEKQITKSMRKAFL